MCQRVNGHRLITSDTVSWPDHECVCVCLFGGTTLSRRQSDLTQLET